MGVLDLTEAQKRKAKLVAGSVLQTEEPMETLGYSEWKNELWSYAQKQTDSREEAEDLHFELKEHTRNLVFVLNSAKGTTDNGVEILLHDIEFENWAEFQFKANLTSYDRDGDKIFGTEEKEYFVLNKDTGRIEVFSQHSRDTSANRLKHSMETLHANVMGQLVDSMISLYNSRCPQGTYRLDFEWKMRHGNRTYEVTEEV